MPVSVNRYGYALDNPLTVTDPTGVLAEDGSPYGHRGRVAREHREPAIAEAPDRA